LRHAFRSLASVEFNGLMAETDLLSSGADLAETNH
jgi:hypothetical protein